MNMQTENIFIVHPATHEQEHALKAFAKALKIKFEVKTEKAYNPEFVSKIEESRQQYKEGNCTVIKTEDLWK
jgi:hypothetical protein